MSVKILEKPLKNGEISLYLVFYVNGKRSYRKLDYRLGTNKEMNKEVRRKAELARCQADLEIGSNPTGFVPSYKTKILVADYYDKFATKAYQKRCKVTIREFFKDTQFRAVTLVLVSQFKDFLLSKFAQNTAYTYMRNIRQMFVKAYKEGLIRCEVYESVKNPQRIRQARPFLSPQEIQKLANAECPNSETRDAWLFEYATGIRHCDWSRLRVEYIHFDWNTLNDENAGGQTIQFTQKKTGRELILPLNALAWSIIKRKIFVTNPETGKLVLRDPNEKIFHTPDYSYVLRSLKIWAKNAGLTRKIGTHIARHSFATNLLESGVDIYILMELLGHTEVRTTQIYAQVLPSSKEKAVKSLPSVTFAS